MIRTAIEYRTDWNGKPNLGEVVWWSTTIACNNSIDVFITCTKPTARQVRQFIKQTKRKYTIRGTVDMIMPDGSLIEFKTSGKNSHNKQQEFYLKQAGLC